MPLPKYKYLLTYRYCEIIHDLTVVFCNKFLYGFDNRRNREQMIQAARSGKQNIIEGVGQSQTSKKGEIKLLGVSMASLEELLADYEDFLRQRKLEIWLKTDRRIAEFRKNSFRLTSLSNLSDLGNLIEKPKLPGSPQDDANFLLTFCHQETYLLDKQIKAATEKFAKEGGIREKLYEERKRRRGY